MRIAFLTPMKSPASSVPSGDRTFARLLLAALASAGHTVVQPTPFRSWRSTPEDFDAVAAEGARAAALAVDALADAPPDQVLTYHNYHKAPDLVGPVIAAAYCVPYAIVEASRAPTRAAGPWAKAFAAADRALAAADALGAVTNRDVPELMAFRPDAVVRFPPFIDTAPFHAPHEGSASGETIVCVAMMREGRKADSIAVLADAFEKVRARRPSARLVSAGAGPARDRLEPLFPKGTMVGRLEQGDLARLLQRCDVFAWPAIAEPFGFTFLEAQAAGLPVVGGAAEGVRDVVRDGETGLLTPEGDATAFAGALEHLLADTPKRRRMGAAAQAFAAANDLHAGALRLDTLLDHAATRFAARSQAARPA